MAKQRGPQNTGKIDPHTFDTKLVEDVNGIASKPNTWSQARNATVNTVEGDLGELSNEQANKFCAAAPYKIIGVIHIDEDKWAIFSTDETDHEIGLFEDGLCKYTTIVNDKCLNFSELHLVKGQAKENFDCTFQIYWDDGNNPTRTMNLEDVPYIENCTDENGQPVPNPGNPNYVPVGCITCISTGALNCDAIRLAPLISNPCFTVQKGPQGGELENGSYFVVGAYVVNDQRVSDYSLPSNVQALFDHRGIAGSLEIIIDDMDPRFDEFELVVVEIRALKTLAKRIGVYNTRQQRISIDIIDERYPTVPLNLIPLRNQIADKSDAIYRNGDYMLRVGPTDKFDFNYQPLANQINTEWVSVEYDADYYRKGGNKTNYLRDEVYPFFVRWVYDTGDKTPSFHIPGRYEPGRGPGEGGLGGSGVFAADASADALPDEVGVFNTVWHVQNTAIFPGPATAITLPDGGIQIGKGQMAYWESSERYDDDNAAVWNASSNPIWGSTNPAHDLCGKQIRHHRFPDNTKGYANGMFITNHYNSDGSKIRVMGVQFSNIKPPLDNQGNPIPNIVGYEILRGTREGNKSIAAKGMINNMREYQITGGTTTRRGLYPNYPYNPTKNNGSAPSVNPAFDKFLGYSNAGTNCNNNGNPFVNHRLFTFHSPDTTFKDPFLSAKELHLYGEVQGIAEGRFQEPDGHPKHKLITNFTFLIGLVAGVGFALIKKNGNRTTTKREPQMLHTGSSGEFVGVAGAGFWAAPSTTLGQFGTPTLQSAIQGPMSAAGTASDISISTNKQFGGNIIDALAGIGPSQWFGLINSKNSSIQSGGSLGGMLGRLTEESSVGGEDRQMPTLLNAIGGAMTFGIAVSEGANVTFDLIRKLSPSQQYALQYISHCFYNQFSGQQIGMIRFALNEAIYLDPDLQDLGTAWRINNLYRGRTVAIETQRFVNDCQGTDNTQQTVGSAISLPVSTVTFADPKKGACQTVAVSHYGGLKQRLRNQYGQIEGIVQVPVTTCMTPITQTTSDVEFGGDTYIGRYTEKNTMHFFYNWLNGQPDYAEFKYQDYQMVDHPLFWMDTYEYDFNEFMNQLMNPVNLLTNPGGFTFPSNKHCLDGSAGIFIKKESYMYLFNSGVRDFFVESEVNIDLRDYGDADSERHYDPYGFSDTSLMFNTALIKSGNFFKYDYSLSIARLYTNYVHWGSTHHRRYNPLIAEDCFVYRPNRVIYSLRQNLENTKDYWRVFLPNNYKDFKSRVTAVKPIGDNGAMMLFENESPVQIKSVDILTTDGGTKLTIGDGGLFSQPLQNVLNTDDSYEYGSCQNRLSVVNTASGIFWMSQNQGKIFQIQNGIKEISAFDNKWWLATYLPYLLTKDPMFANTPFELTDNPVAGIGCQTIYDNQAQLIYFCKKDYFLRDDLVDTVTYVSGNDFLVNGALPIKLGDPDYFHDASWTISYNPKTQGWIGYHDWHPDLLIPGKTNFLSILDNGIWRHNDRCDLYCNYYGVDYPFEVEYAVVTPQIVNTLRSVEYYMEVYKYDTNCYDRFHVLDFNFDEATIYNSEQCSGLLNLNLSPKNNAPEIVTYPRINPADIDILYNKVEQKYRFNQFWDITADRGEFNAIAERMIFNTEANGYIRNLNPNNLDYNKFQTQRKKFRHYKNTVLLRRRVCGNRNMLVSLANNKDLMSPR